MNEITKILEIIRAYAEAISRGKIKASQIKNMTDEELASFNDDLSAMLEAKQKEAEDEAKI